MARRNSYNKRDLNFGTNIVSSLLATLIYLPISLLSNNASSNLDYYSKNYPENVPLKSIKLRVTHIICGGLFFCGPILFLFLLEMGCWLFFAIIFTLIYEIVFAIPLIEFTDKLKHRYIFNSFDLNEQVGASRFVLKLWITILVIHFIFLLLYNVSYWGVTLDVLKYNYLGDNKISYGLYEIFEDTYEATFISKKLLIVALFVNICIVVYFFKWDRDLSKNLTKNSSISKILKYSNQVDVDVLCELYDRKDISSKLVFVNGSCLKRIDHSNILDSGFVLIDKSGKKTSYCFNGYVKTHSELIRKGSDVLKRIEKDINAQLQVHDIDFMLYNSSNNIINKQEH